MLNLTTCLTSEGVSRTRDGETHEKTSGNGKKMNGLKWNTSYGIKVKVNLTGKSKGKNQERGKLTGSI